MLAWSSLGALVVELGYFEEGAEILRRSLDLSTDDPMVNDDLGWALAHADPPDVTTSLAEYSEANRLAPGQPWLMKNLADTLQDLRRDGAEELYRKIIERLEQDPRTDLSNQYMLGWCLFRLRELGRAGRYLFAATALPLDSEVRFDLGLVSLCREKDDQAERLQWTGLLGLFKYRTADLAHWPRTSRSRCA